MSPPGTNSRGAGTATDLGNDLPRIPIVLGVVGHRNIRPEDEAPLRAQIKRILTEFREAYPHSPLVLLSAMAEGADWIAAQEAAELDWEVRGCLPFPAGVYELSTSFSGDPLPNFTKLPFAVDSFEVPLPDSDLPFPDLVAVATDLTDPDCIRERQRRYANAGGYIVRHCHALIALWDGDLDPRDEKGRALRNGTADMVKFKLTGEAPPDYPIRDILGYGADVGPVIQIVTPRSSGELVSEPFARKLWLPSQGQLKPEKYAEEIVKPEPDSSRFVRRVASALGIRSVSPERFSLRGLADYMNATDEDGTAFIPPHGLIAFRETCQLVDDFNRDICYSGEQIRPALQDKRAKADLDMAASSTLKRQFEKISSLRHAASCLADALEDDLSQLQKILFFLLFAAIAAYDLYTHLLSPDPVQLGNNPIWLKLFLLMLFIAAALVCHVWWQGMDTRRLDYRAFSEALRVRFFWGLAGLGQSVADTYLNQLRGEIAWARRALHDICPPPQFWQREFQACDPATQKTRLRAVRKHWTSDQTIYYERALQRNHHKAVLCRRWGLALAVVGWFIALFLLCHECPDTPSASGSYAAAHAVAQHNADHPLWCPRHPNHWLLITSGLLAAAGGLIVAFSERRSYEEQALQFERMLGVFKRGDRLLEELLEGGSAALTADELKSAHDIIARLGLEALTEHAQWLILRRARPFELQIGG